MSCPPNTHAHETQEGDRRVLACELDDGTRHGPYRVIEHDGTVQTQGAYDHGASDGPWTVVVGLDQRVTTVYEAGVPLHTTLVDAHGQMLYSGAYEDGLHHGTWVYGYPDGQLKTRGDFDRGHKSGVWTSWYANGQTMSEGTYVDNALDGDWRWWYESGQRMAIEPYAEGALHGLYLEWHESGQPSREGRYERGARQGLWRFWSEEGALTEAAMMVDNQVVYREQYDLQGQLIAAGAQAPQPNGVSIKHGDWLYRHPNGQPSSRGAYVDGLEHGPWSYWNEDGSLRARGAFERGHKSGTWSVWRDATTLFEVCFHDPPNAPLCRR